MQPWSSALLKPHDPQCRFTHAEAWHAYLVERPLSRRSKELYVYNLERYLPEWKNHTLEAIGNDRAGVRALYHQPARERGVAIAWQVIRMLAAVYRYQRRVAPSLPECPTLAVGLPSIKPRDWALSADQSREWWQAVERLSPVKRMWWLTCLLTGAPRGSIEALRWEDVNFQPEVITFRVTKGDRPYAAPAPHPADRASPAPSSGRGITQRVGLHIAEEAWLASGRRAARQAGRGWRASSAPHLPDGAGRAERHARSGAPADGKLARRRCLARLHHRSPAGGIASPFGQRGGQPLRAAAGMGRSGRSSRTFAVKAEKLRCRARTGALMARGVALDLGYGKVGAGLHKVMHP